MSSVLTATIENKTTSVTTYFEEINNREQQQIFSDSDNEIILKIA